MFVVLILKLWIHLHMSWLIKQTFKICIWIIDTVIIILSNGTDRPEQIVPRYDATEHGIWSVVALLEHNAAFSDSSTGEILGLV